jgi:hypothetical protein
MQPTWLLILSWVALAAGLTSAAVIVVDESVLGYRQPVRILEVVWPVTALYFGPETIAAYRKWGRPQSLRWRERHGNPPKKLENPALLHLCHCGAHCTLGAHPHDAILRQARRDWPARDDLRATYRQHRPMVERSIAWLVGPKGRCRKLRYRGVTANDWWLHSRMAALNLRRLINLGPNHQSGAWLLAPAT